MHEGNDSRPYASSISTTASAGGEAADAESVSPAYSIASSRCYGAVYSSGPPSRQNDGPTSKQQESWEEMNRRFKMDRKFENAAPKTVQQIEELNAEKSTEEHRRLQWALDRENYDRATVSADNTHADPTALSAPITSEQPTASETPHIRNSKSRRGLAKFSRFLMKPWAKARRTLGVGGKKKPRIRMR